MKAASVEPGVASLLRSESSVSLVNPDVDVLRAAPNFSPILSAGAVRVLSSRCMSEAQRVVIENYSTQSAQVERRRESYRAFTSDAGVGGLRRLAVASTEQKQERGP
jgi:hypothetical protein